MTNVLVVEDQRMPRENIERILADSKRYRLVASISDASLALMS
ncbi:MAG: DNA-binding response regulator, partial [Lachnospiraceae bacterium]